MRGTGAGGIDQGIHRGGDLQLLELHRLTGKADIQVQALAQREHDAGAGSRLEADRRHGQRVAGPRLHVVDEVPTIRTRGGGISLAPLSALELDPGAFHPAAVDLGDEALNGRAGNTLSNYPSGKSRQEGQDEESGPSLTNGISHEGSPTCLSYGLMRATTTNTIALVVEISSTVTGGRQTRREKGRCSGSTARQALDRVTSGSSSRIRRTFARKTSGPNGFSSSSPND